MTYWKLFSKLKSGIPLFTCFYIRLNVAGYKHFLKSNIQYMGPCFKIKHVSKCFSLSLKRCKYDPLNIQLFILPLRTSREQRAAYKGWGSSGSKGSPEISDNHLGGIIIV